MDPDDEDNDNDIDDDNFYYAMSDGDAAEVSSRFHITSPSVHCYCILNDNNIQSCVCSQFDVRTGVVLAAFCCCSLVRYIHADSVLAPSVAWREWSNRCQVLL